MCTDDQYAIEDRVWHTATVDWYSLQQLQCGCVLPVSGHGPDPLTAHSVAQQPGEHGRRTQANEQKHTAWYTTTLVCTYYSHLGCYSWKHAHDLFAIELHFKTEGFSILKMGSLLLHNTNISMPFTYTFKCFLFDALDCHPWLQMALWYRVIGNEYKVVT